MKLLLVVGLAAVCAVTLADKITSEIEDKSVVTLEQHDKHSHILNVDKKKELDAFEAVESADSEIDGQTRIKRSPTTPIHHLKASKRRNLKRKLWNQRNALKKLQRRQRRAKNQRIRQRAQRVQRKRQWRSNYNQWKNRRNAWVQQVKIRNEVARQLRG